MIEAKSSAEFSEESKDRPSAWLHSDLRIALVLNIAKYDTLLGEDKK